MQGRHRLTDGPKGVGMLPAPTPSGLEPETRIEEAWHWRGWLRVRDGDDRTPHKSPRTPLEEGSIPWEESGWDD